MWEAVKTRDNKVLVNPLLDASGHRDVEVDRGPLAVPESHGGAVCFFGAAALTVHRRLAEGDRTGRNGAATVLLR